MSPTSGTNSSGGGVVLACRSPEFEQRVREAFDGELNHELRRWEDKLDAVDPTETVDAIAALNPDLVTIGPGLSFDEWARLAEAFDREHPEICVLLVAEPTPRLWEVALHSGVRDVVSPDAEDKEVRAAMERALPTAHRPTAGSRGAPAGGATGEVMVVVGPKGGVGKTTIASNLAVGLAMAAPRDVVLVDLDLQFGDVAHNLRIDPDRTIADVLRFGADKDVTALKAFLTPHPAGLYVLCAPDSPADMDDMDSERVARVVRALAESFPYVVVDTGSGMDEFALAAFEVATDFVLVGVTDVPSVRATRKALEVLDRLGLTSQNRHFVLNRSDRQVGLSVKDIEETVGMSVDVAVPSTTIVTVSVNQGTPLLVSGEASEPAEAMFELVSRFVELPADVSRGRRRMKVR